MLQGFGKTLCIGIVTSELVLHSTGSKFWRSTKIIRALSSRTIIAWSLHAVDSVSLGQEAESQVL